MSRPPVRPMSHPSDPVSEADLAAVTAQLGRAPRGVVGVGHRCPCGAPDVVLSAPVLPDGSPFPTVYYLTCPRASGRIGTLEGSGEMRRLAEELEGSEELQAAVRVAHERFLADRAGLAADRGLDVPHALGGVSAGGMPNRVKCLHVFAAQALACGPGVNPIGDRVLDRIGAWWQAGPCVEVEERPSVGEPR